MRLRNIKGAHDIIGTSEYVVLDYKKYKGNWKNIFKNDNGIQIEIGMGKGDFIIETAKQNPNINFIGIEKYATVLVYAIKKLQNIKIDNLKIINADALEVDEIFENEIDKIYLNFSDPWPKKRHSNRRLTSSIFLDKYSKIFKGNYLIEMKTDNQKLFEYSLITLSQKKYFFEEINLNLYNNLNLDNIQTEYEKKFVNRGMIIYKLKAIQKIDKNEKIDC